MKRNINNQSKEILRAIIELQSLLNQYQQDGDLYDQERTLDIQTAITALDVLTIRILNEN